MWTLPLNKLFMSNTTEDKKIIIKKKTYKQGDNLVVCGAGKFNESKLVLNKEQAMLLYIDLHEFIKSFKPE